MGSLVYTTYSRAMRVSCWSIFELPLAASFDVEIYWFWQCSQSGGLCDQSGDRGIVFPPDTFASAAPPNRQTDTSNLIQQKGLPSNPSVVLSRTTRLHPAKTETRGVLVQNNRLCVRHKQVPKIRCADVRLRNELLRHCSINAFYFILFYIDRFTSHWTNALT